MPDAVKDTDSRDETRVVVVVEGGCLRSVYSSLPSLRVELIDCDDLKDDADSEDVDDVVDAKTEGMTEVW